VIRESSKTAVRALVVDDSSSMRRLLRQLLLERSYDVSVAASGEEALELHRQRPFELVVTDWTLPGISGVDVCRAIRAGDGGEDPFILVITGRNRHDDLAAVLDAGASDFVAKPIDADLLFTRLGIAERAVYEARRRRAYGVILEDTESRFEHMVQNLPGVAFRCELDPSAGLRFGYVSSGIRELLQITPEEAIADPERVFRVLQGDERGKGAGPFSRFQGLSAASTPNDQVQVTLPSGVTKWIQVMGRPGRQKDGRVVFDGIMIDVTEHRRAQHRLRASEEAFRSLIEGLPDSVLVVRGERIVYANPRAVGYLGYEGVVDLLGRRLGDFLEDRRAPRIDEGQRPQPVEVQLLRADGQAVAGEATHMPVIYAGQPSILVVVRDVTERKQMQSRLVLADRMASVGTLAAGVAHEINNPLSYVLSNLRLTREALDKALDPDSVDAMRQQLEEAIHGAERMRHIVRDLKTFSQVESEQRDVVDAQEVLESSLNICWNEIRHRARLEKDLKPTPPVMVNESRLGQVFLNLLINASQAMADDRLDRNVLRVRTYTDEAGFAVFEVSDTGEGIPPENLARIFDPFFTTKTLNGGTGLGLSICHNIVKAIGGEIHASSDVGAGTTMRVRLPPGQRSRRRTRSSQTISTVGAGGLQAKVVVIDDELLVGKSIRRALRGHDVEVYASGREAIEHLCGGGWVDVVFCDLMMPETSGIEVFEAVHQRRPEIAARFVFMTGGAFTPRARAFLEKSEQQCLEKPFELQEIRELVKEWAGLGLD
jgi:PAS domain S-box-containing protein